ncbi:MAG: hypothetical protein LBK53_09710 [Heliobacteriaceae bacterium]|jgi:hypothetical protein|nr:hypothetical protein [Heliobacteriaceae bacterium]
MKTEKIQIFSKNLAVQNKPTANNTAFTGTIPYHRVNKDDIYPFLPASFRVMKKIKNNMGEAQNIIINAVGTALVAPIFIKWNPFSKTDEETRTYTAWRQPVSAVLAIITQVGITIPFNKIIDNAANTGDMGVNYNRNSFQDKKYLAKQLKKNHPKLSDSKIKPMAENLYKKQEQIILDDIEARNKIEYNMRGKNKESIGTLYHEVVNETMDDLIRGTKHNLEMLDYKSEKRLERAQFYRKNEDFCKGIIAEIDTKVNNINASDVKEDDIKGLTKFLKQKIDSIKRDKTKKEMAKVLDEIYVRCIVLNDPKVAYKEVCDKVSRVKEYISIDAKDDTNLAKLLQEKTANEYEELSTNLKKLREIQDDMKKSGLPVSKIQERIDDFVTKFNNEAIHKYFTNPEINIKTPLTEELTTELKEIAEKFNTDEIIPDRKKLLTRLQEIVSDEFKKVDFSALDDYSFAEKVLKKYTGKIESNIKCLKQVTGLVVSLAILPFTCILLNWTYPKFMDIFFPHLSNQKHSKETKKFVDKTAENCEVKS